MAAEPLAGRYELVEPLGVGGFGQTFLALDLHLPGQPYCVVKQLKPWSQDETTLVTAKRLFDLEAQTLYRLGSHDQIPRLVAHFAEQGNFFLVQEYIPGQSLDSELTKRGRFSETETLALLNDLLTVLAFVHDQQVIHRDVKPANIIRRAAEGANTQSQLVLIDFGIVKQLNAQKMIASDLTVAIGSTGYMAPEQQMGRPSFASDLYAVGMVALQALSAEHPKNFAKDAFTHEVSCTTLGLTLSPPLAQFLDTLVRYDHHQRYPTAQVALNALQQIELSPTPPLPDTAITYIPEQTTLPVATDSPPIVPTAIPLSPANLSQQTYRNRQALLNKVRRFWIQGVLEHSLHDQVLLTLGLEERPDAVAVPWNISWQVGQNPVQSLPEGTQVSEIFHLLGEGRSLLILGEPGAGKTTTLLALARDLLHQAEQSWQPRMPVVFNLSSWQEESIEQWLVNELNSKYQVPKAIGQEWVQQQQLLLLLDGLDEVALTLREDCVLALNQFHQNYSPEMVVCSRIKDYEALKAKLGLQSALYLKSLTPEQIWQYLNQSSHGLTGLKHLLEHEPQVQDQATSLLTLAQSPLMLNIMVLAYQGVNVSEFKAFQPGDDYKQQLFTAYVERMFQRRSQNSDRFSAAQTIQWLHHLACYMQQTSQSVFLIERIQPDWLKRKRQRWSYGVGVWTSFFAIAATVGIHVMNPDRLALALLIGGVICCRIFGVYRITPAETLRWSWQKALKHLWLGLTIGPLIGWLLKVGFGLIFGSAPCLLNGECLGEFSLIGLSFGAFLGVTYSLIRGLSGESIAIATQPNQGIRQSARNAILFGLVAAVALLIPGLILNNTKASFWAASGLAFGIATGGGEAVVKHAMLRLILFSNGLVPWHYSRFLDHATARIFLQKVGGGYIFIHRLLLEYFASITTTKTLTQTLTKK
jgi:serine/threonine protein kinase/DNA polymerase III delta prime subunit